ncbi:MAG: PadR family transcriptional regulator [Anaerolineales bacterium]|nr:PadR family transcriptional regulator [Anaerolineales bacterium]
MVTQEEYPALLEALTGELRRGALVLAVLSQLHERQYGYSLKQQLAAQALDIPEGTLYPLLRRLEAQGLLESEWELASEARPRRYYRISPQGREALADLGQEWQALSRALRGLLKEEKK